MDFNHIRLSGNSDVDLYMHGVSGTDPYILKTVDGLGPPDIDIFTGVPLDREIVIRVGLNPSFSVGQTVQDIRSELYKLISPGYSGLLTVYIMKDLTVLASTIGRIKRFEINPFSQSTEVQITISCQSAYLTAPSAVLLTGLPKSEFSFTNQGTAPTGIYIQIELTAAGNSWSITHTDPTTADPVTMTLNFDFLVGDILTFNTEPGSRDVTLFRTGFWWHATIVAELSADSTWFMLHSGVNTFVPVNTLFNFMQVSYTPKFWGV